MSGANALTVQALDKRFGGIHVTRGVSLSLAAGERVALIGPNGAGKTTLVNLISGVLQPSSGAVQLAGHNITHLSQPQRVRAGLARTFQITTLPMHLPVQHLVEMALHQRDGLAARMWASIDRQAGVREEAMGILQELSLERFAAHTPAQMAYGEQRLVELALALALRPRVLLLDEPMAGVPRGESVHVLNALDRLPPDLAVLIIEHDMDLVFSFAHRIVVLAEGAVLAEGTPDEIRRHPAVRTAYLGTKG